MPGIASRLKSTFLLISAVLVALVVFLVWQMQGGGQFDIRKSASAWEPPVGAASGTAAPREPCVRYDPLRRAFFGDLHVHTSLSNDARGRDMLASAADAYRFARGEEIALGPFIGERAAARTAQLRQPLDFAAVTDHAEYMGEVYICTTLPPNDDDSADDDSASYNSESCQLFRGATVAESGKPGGEERAEDSGFSFGIKRMSSLGGWFERNAEICGPNNRLCREGLKSAWENNQAITEQYYDRSGDCSFTTFHGYEYSDNVSISKVHRNIIFRNEIVPEIPISALEQPDAMALLTQIESLCNDTAGDCDAVSIPHNPNASNGRMFLPMFDDEPVEDQRRLAALRARMEPMVEMMQVKGESECRPGMWNVLGEDELCDFEKIYGVQKPMLDDCEDSYGSGGSGGFGCQSRLDFVRYALIEGMVEEQRLGVNPYQFGFVGGTDTHNATPGATKEDQFQGCCSDVDTTPAERLSDETGFARLPMRRRNPGGLMGVWAEENSRDSLFDAIQRREVFATSGNRIQPRFFAGHDLPDTLCDGDIAKTGYQQGVPMGGVLEMGSTGASPVFVAAASADPQGGLLQRLQIVKVWPEGEQIFHQQVHDIAGDKNNGATVDLQDCSVRGPGNGQLCATWRDPEFDPAQSAAYYLRVIENPSCRWTWHDCLTFPEDARPASCEDPAVDKIIQERAWSSPIWYSP